MNIMQLFDSSVWLRLALTLGHFLWQGALIALLALLFATVMGRRSARRRYATHLTGLCAMVAAVGATFALIDVPAAPVVVEDEVPVAEPTLQFDDVNVAAVDPTPIEPPLIGEIEPAPLPAQTEVELPAVEAKMTVGQRIWDRIDWRRYAPYVMSVYCLGVLLMSLRLALGLRGGQLLRRASLPVDDPAILSALARQATALGMRFTPGIAYCRKIVVPTVVGVMRPTILLPFSLATGLSIEQIEMLLGHELAHIRRLDPLINVLQRVVEAVLFFHPAVWLVSHRIRVERENCCDDLALSGGGSAASYASSLVEMARQALAQQRGALAVNGLNAAGKPSQLRGRIQRLLPHSQRERFRLRRSWVFLALAGVVFATACVSQLQSRGAAESSRLVGTTGDVASDSSDATSDSEAASERVSAETEDGFTFTVRLPNGSPAAGATVHVVYNSSAWYVGELREPAVTDEREITSDAEGTIKMPAPRSGIGLFISSEKGYACRPHDKLAADTEVQLEPWGRIEGTIHTGKRPGEKDAVVLQFNYPYMPDRRNWPWNVEPTMTGPGRFVFERVPAGEVAVCRTVKRDGTAKMFTHTRHVEVKSGQTAKVAIGETGRPVIGRLLEPEGFVREVYWAGPDPASTGRVVTAVQLPPPLPPTPEDAKERDPEKRLEEWMQSDAGKSWLESDAGEAWLKGPPRFSGPLERDGSFRIDSVSAGRYWLTARIESPAINPLNQKPQVVAELRRGFTVPEMPGGRSDEPLDIGVFTMKLPEEPARDKPTTKPAEMRDSPFGALSEVFPPPQRWSWQSPGEKPDPDLTWEKAWAEAIDYRRGNDLDRKPMLKMFQRFLDTNPPRQRALFARLDMGAALTIGFQPPMDDEALPWYAQTIRESEDMVQYRHLMIAKLHMASLLSRNGHAERFGEIMDHLYASILDVDPDEIILDNVQDRRHELYPIARSLVSDPSALDDMSHADMRRLIENSGNDQARTLLKERQHSVDSLRRSAIESWTRSKWNVDAMRETKAALEALKNRYVDEPVCREVIDKTLAQADHVMSFERPATTAPATQPASAGTLEIRILATHSPATPEILDASNPKYREPVEKYMKQLAEHGPAARPDDHYIWIEIAAVIEDERFGPQAVTAEHEGKDYVLAHARADMCLLADGTWSLLKVEMVKDPLDRPAVSFTLDKRGGERMADLTKRNIGYPMAMIVDGRVISSATIRSEIRGRGQITGSFTEDFVQNLVRQLQFHKEESARSERPTTQPTTQPAEEQRIVRVYTLNHANAKTVARKVNGRFAHPASADPRDAITATAHDKLNAVIVTYHASKEKEIRARLADWDTPPEQTIIQLIAIELTGDPERVGDPKLAETLEAAGDDLMNVIGRYGKVEVISRPSILVNWPDGPTTVEVGEQVPVVQEVRVGKDGKLKPAVGYEQTGIRMVINGRWLNDAKPRKAFVSIDLEQTVLASSKFSEQHGAFDLPVFNTHSTSQKLEVEAGQPEIILGDVIMGNQKSKPAARMVYRLVFIPIAPDDPPRWGNFGGEQTNIDLHVIELRGEASRIADSRLEKALEEAGDDFMKVFGRYGKAEIKSMPRLTALWPQPASVEIAERMPVVEDVKLDEDGSRLSTISHKPVGFRMEIDGQWLDDTDPRKAVVNVKLKHSALGEAKVKTGDVALPLFTERTTSTRLKLEAGKAGFIGGDIEVPDDKSKPATRYFYRLKVTPVEPGIEPTTQPAGDARNTEPTWAEAEKVWAIIAAQHLANMQKQMPDKDLRWVEYRSDAIRRFLPDHRIYVLEGCRQVNASALFALSRTGQITDLGQGDISTTDDDRSRNEQLADFILAQDIVLSDEQDVIDCVRLIQDLAGASNLVTVSKINNVKLPDPHIFDRDQLDVGRNNEYWKMTATRQDSTWTVAEEYVGPPASIMEPGIWKLTIDENNCLVDFAIRYPWQETREP